MVAGDDRRYAGVGDPSGWRAGKRRYCLRDVGALQPLRSHTSLYNSAPQQRGLQVRAQPPPPLLPSVRPSVRLSLPPFPPPPQPPSFSPCCCRHAQASCYGRFRCVVFRRAPALSCPLCLIPVCQRPQHCLYTCSDQLLRLARRYANIASSV